MVAYRTGQARYLRHRVLTNEMFSSFMTNYRFTQVLRTQSYRQLVKGRGEGQTNKHNNQTARDGRYAINRGVQPKVSFCGQKEGNTLPHLAPALAKIPQ